MQVPINKFTEHDMKALLSYARDEEFSQVSDAADLYRQIKDGEELTLGELEVKVKVFAAAVNVQGPVSFMRKWDQYVNEAIYQQF